MKPDIQQALRACYCFEVPQDSPEYYLTEQYRTYRQTLAEFSRQEQLIRTLVKTVPACFPDPQPIEFVDLVIQPEIWFENPLPEIGGDVSGPIVNYRVHVSGLGPFWHMEIEIEEVLDEEIVETFNEPAVTPELLASYEQLSSKMNEIGYREVTAEEAWTPVDFLGHLKIPHPYVRVGHLLFNDNCAFGVEDFEDLLLGLLSQMDEDDDEMWFDEEEGGPVRFH